MIDDGTIFTICESAIADKVNMFATMRICEKLNSTAERYSDEIEELVRVCYEFPELSLQSVKEIIKKRKDRRENYPYITSDGSTFGQIQKLLFRKFIVSEMRFDSENELD